MTTELSTQRSTGLSSIMADAGLDMDISDIVIPRIHLMQKMSQLVDEKIAQPGEIRDSVDHALLGSEKHPLQIAIASVHRTLITFKNGDYFSTEALTRENNELPWEEKLDGDVIKRQKAYNFLVLLPITQCEGLPYVLSMKSTNSAAAKWINGKILRETMNGGDYRKLVFELSVQKEKNDKGSFYTYRPKLLSDLLSDEMSARVSQWTERVAKREIKVDGESTRDEI